MRALRCVGWDDMAWSLRCLHTGQGLEQNRVACRYFNAIPSNQLEDGSLMGCLLHTGIPRFGGG